MKKFILSLIVLFPLLGVSQSVDYTTDVSQGCYPLTVHFTNTSTGCTSYDWDFGDGSPIIHDINPTHIYLQPGNYSPSLTGYDSWGYVGYTQYDIIVMGTDLVINPNDTVCPGTRVWFHPDPNNIQLNSIFYDFGNNDTTSYAWDIDHIYDSTGVYQVTMIIDQSFCGVDTIVKTIVVTNTAIPPVSAWSSIETVCPFNDVKFNTSNEMAAQYLWDFDDGTTSTQMNPVHAFASTGNKMVTLTVTNSCGNSNSASVHIAVTDTLSLQLSMNYWGNSNNCPNSVIQFSSNNSGSFNWTFDTLGTAAGKEVQFLFPDTGKYLVTLEGTNGCGSSDSITEYIYIKYDTTNIPYVEFSFDNFEYTGGDTLTVCPGTKVNFWNDSEYENIFFTWDFGDGTTSVLRDPKHTFNNLGTYTVNLIGENYCGGKDTATKIVLINNSIYPNASLMSFPTTLCPGEIVYFFNDQGSEEDLSNSSLNYSIWYGDGDSLINPTEYTDTTLHIFTHYYDSIGTFNYLFQLTNTCGNSSQITGTITVDTTSGTPYDFTMEGDIFHENDDFCPYDLLEFYAIGGSSYFWDFGDGTTSTDIFPQHAYQDTGFYNVSLIISNTCGASDTLYSGASITGNNLPDPWFNTDNYQVCVNDTIHFYYGSGGNSDSYLFFWDFDDGTTSTQMNPIHVYSQVGNYMPKLIVTNGCGSDSSFNQIQVKGPKINFMADNTVSFPGSPIHFTNLTNNAISYSWNFGDGNTSTQTSPTHSYASYGSYDITLTATGFTGCTDSLTLTDYILISNMQIISQVHNPVCHDDPAGIDIAVSGGVPPYNYLWSDGSTNQDLNLFNSVSGTYSVTIVDNSGTTVEQSFTVTNPAPISVFVNTTDENCIGDGSGSAIFNISGGIAPYSLEINNQTYNVTTSNYTVAGLDTGVYYYSLTDTNGCLINGNFHIGWSGNTAFNYYYIPIWPSCSTNNGSIAIDYSGTALFSWSNGYTTSTISNLSPGTYSVTVQNANGCTDSVTVGLGTSDGPSVSLVHSYELCPGANNGMAQVQINVGNPTYTYLWNNGATSSMINNLSSGVYSVTVTDSVGCLQVLSDEITESEPINATFLKQDPLCYGSYTGSATVYVSGGCGSTPSYQWSNGSYSDHIINRNAGTYYVTIDECGCQAVTSVTLEDPEPLYTQVTTSAVSFTNYSDGTADVLTLNGVPPYSYQWSSGESTSYISGKPAGTYFVTITDNNGCSTVDTAVIENQPIVPVDIQASGDTVFCEGGSITLDAGQGFDAYHWSTGATTQTITVSETGNYGVLVASGSSLGIDTIHVLVSHPFDQEQICVVTVDSASSKNKIVWEKTPNVGIISYNIYRLYGSQYLQIGNVPYDDMSEFIDSSSTPDVHADRYKISVIDTCGNESALSYYHQTINLGATQSYISGNVIVVLDWSDYEEESGNDTIDWYYIYTGSTANTMQVFDSISATFTDFNIINPVNQYYFKIGALLEQPCIPTSSAKANGGPYAQSVSNIDDYSVNTAIDNPDFQNIVLVYPNPFNDYTTIKFDNRDKTEYSLIIFDVTGQEVKKIEDITNDKIILRKDNLTSGFYSFELKGKYNYHGRLIITE